MATAVLAQPCLQLCLHSLPAALLAHSRSQLCTPAEAAMMTAHPLVLAYLHHVMYLQLCTEDPPCHAAMHCSSAMPCSHSYALQFCHVMQPQLCTAFSEHHAAAAMHYRLSCMMLEPDLCTFLHAPLSHFCSHAYPPQQLCSTYTALHKHHSSATHVSHSPQPFTSATHLSHAAAAPRLSSYSNVTHQSV